MDIKTDTLRALLLIAAKKDTRFYLNGVYITRTENGNALAVSTDGHRALFVELPTNAPGWAPAIIPRAALDLAMKTEKGESLTINQDSIRGSHGSAFLYEPIPANYPDVSLILPDHSEHNGPAFGFNAEYVGDFAKVAKLLAGKSGSGISIVYPDSKSSKGAALITFGTDSAIGVLMSLRASVCADVNVAKFRPAQKRSIAA